MSMKENHNQIPQQVYDDMYKSDSNIQRMALDRSHSIRQFEIDLYWRRATYFWAFIGSVFVAYGLIFTSDQENGKDIALLITSSIGTVFSFAWVLVNKGSKFYQENWEAHIDLLEDEITGPLYKSVMDKSIINDKEHWIKRILVGPSKFSVSKINQMVSIYVATVWIILCISSLYQVIAYSCYYCISSHCILGGAVLFVSICTIIAFFKCGHTGKYCRKLDNKDLFDYNGATVSAKLRKTRLPSYKNE